MKILITEFIDESVLALFGEGFDISYQPSLVDNRDELLSLLASVDALIVRNRTQVDKLLLKNAPRLKVVGRLGVGLDNIDLNECRARNIAVCPATGANTQSVVEYVIGAMMVLVRGAYHSSDRVVAGDWPRAQLGQGGEIRGRTLGLIGFGSIAQSLAHSAKSLGLKVVAYDPFLPVDAKQWTGVINSEIAELLLTSDIVSLHIPLTDETMGLFDASKINQMKPGAVLINTSRGEIVDDEAIIEALKTGQLGGAALDVFSSEPLPAEQGVKFKDCPNLILTPHIAGITEEANSRVSLVTVENVKRSLSAERSTD